MKQRRRENCRSQAAAGRHGSHEVTNRFRVLKIFGRVRFRVTWNQGLTVATATSTVESFPDKSSGFLTRVERFLKPSTPGEDVSTDTGVPADTRSTRVQLACSSLRRRQANDSHRSPAAKSFNKDGPSPVGGPGCQVRLCVKIKAVKTVGSLWAGLQPPGVSG